MAEKPQLRLLTAEEILGSDDITFEDVEVSEWGGTVRVKALSGKERDHIEASMIQLKRDGKGKVIGRQQNLTNLRAKIVAGSAVDADGKLLFTSDQVEALGKKNAAAIQKVFLVAQRLSALSDDDIAELVDDLGKGQSADGGSD